MEQATPRFELSDVNPAPARLPYSKLDWLNGVYIRELEPSRLATAAKPFLEAAGLPVDDGLLLKAIPLVRERIKTLREAVSWLDFLFIDQLAYDPSLLVENRVGPAGSLLALTRVREVLAALTDFETERLEAALRTLVADLGVKPAQLFGIVRVAVSGKTVAPPLFGTLGALGKDRVLARLDQAINLLSRLVM
jgi:glutamyl-tRNA synthetase